MLAGASTGPGGGSELLVEAAPALLKILGAVVALAVGYWLGIKRKRYDAIQGALTSLHNARTKEFRILWDKVGDVCTPNDRQLEYGTLPEKDLDSCYNGIDDWYRKSGLLLDAESRVWAILLREKTAELLRKGTAPLPWQQDEWPKLWLIKTALRISIERAIAAPGFESEGRRHQTWRVPGYLICLPVIWHFSTFRMRRQLSVKFRIVDQLSSAPRSSSLRRQLVTTVVRSTVPFWWPRGKSLRSSDSDADPGSCASNPAAAPVTATLAGDQTDT